MSFLHHITLPPSKHQMLQIHDPSFPQIQTNLQNTLKVWGPQSRQYRDAREVAENAVNSAVKTAGGTRSSKTKTEVQVLRANQVNEVKEVEEEGHIAGGTFKVGGEAGGSGSDRGRGREDLGARNEDGGMADSRGSGGGGGDKAFEKVADLGHDDLVALLEDLKIGRI